MQKNTSLVVTSIAAPNRVLKTLAAGCFEHDVHFYVIGDVSSPSNFSLSGCDFYHPDRQANTGLRFVQICPQKHYAQKNIGYSLAIRANTEQIIETDDDNIPNEAFWNDRNRYRRVPVMTRRGWLNVYAYFTESNIWPRGLPLDAALTRVPPLDTLHICDVDAPIQQGLADRNPDVDAVYRLVLPLPLSFRTGLQVTLDPARGALLTVKTLRGGETHSRYCIFPLTARFA